jgi:hypothetical protein
MIALWIRLRPKDGSDPRLPGGRAGVVLHDPCKRRRARSKRNPTAQARLRSMDRASRRRGWHSALSAVAHVHGEAEIKPDFATRNLSRDLLRVRRGVDSMCRTCAALARHAHFSWASSRLAGTPRRYGTVEVAIRRIVISSGCTLSAMRRTWRPRFGIRSIVVTPTMRVVAGRHRVEACRTWR